jgi:hypothetical protein
MPSVIDRPFNFSEKIYHVFLYLHIPPLNDDIIETNYLKTDKDSPWSDAN